MSDIHVLTGGPGANKNALLDAMVGKGFYLMRSVAGYISSRYREQECSVFPPINFEDFQKEVLTTQQKWISEIPSIQQKDEIPMRIIDPLEHYSRLREQPKLSTLNTTPARDAISVRGIPDALAYYNIRKVQPPKELLIATKLYQYGLIFLLKPTQTYSSAPQDRKREVVDFLIHQEIEKVYKSLGYDPIHIQATTKNEQLEEIMHILSSSKLVAPAVKLKHIDVTLQLVEPPLFLTPWQPKISRYFYIPFLVSKKHEKASLSHQKIRRRLRSS